MYANQIWTSKKNVDGWDDPTVIDANCCEVQQCVPDKIDTGTLDFSDLSATEG